METAIGFLQGVSPFLLILVGIAIGFVTASTWKEVVAKTEEAQKTLQWVLGFAFLVVAAAAQHLLWGMAGAGGFFSHAICGVAVIALYVLNIHIEQTGGKTEIVPSLVLIGAIIGWIMAAN